MLTRTLPLWKHRVSCWHRVPCRYRRSSRNPFRHQRVNIDIEFVVEIESFFLDIHRIRCRHWTYSMSTSHSCSTFQHIYFNIPPIYFKLTRFPLVSSLSSLKQPFDADKVFDADIKSFDFRSSSKICFFFFLLKSLNRAVAVLKCNSLSYIWKWFWLRPSQ